MKKFWILPLCASLVLLPSCSSSNAAGRAMTGASLGAMFGGALGGITGGYRGHDIGTMVGLIAGGAIGAATGAAEDAAAQRRYEASRSATTSRSERRSLPPVTPQQQEETAAAVCPLVLRNLRFVGEDGNQEFNRGETCQIIFELANPTTATVRNIVPYLSELNGNEHILISPTTRIEAVGPGDAIRYTAVVKNDNKLKEGTATFRIAVSTDNGEFVTLRDFSVTTAK